LTHAPQDQQAASGPTAATSAAGPCAWLCATAVEAPAQASPLHAGEPGDAAHGRVDKQHRAGPQARRGNHGGTSDATGIATGRNTLPVLRWGQVMRVALAAAVSRRVTTSAILMRETRPARGKTVHGERS